MEATHENLRATSVNRNGHCPASKEAPGHDPSTTDLESKATPQGLSAHTNQPNGGLAAWLQVLGGFFLFFNTFGAMNTFGVFQTYYEGGELFHQSSSNIAWIGAIQSACLQAMGIIAGPLYDRGGFRILILAGSFGVVLGYMMLSLCHKFWQVIITQGFLTGIAQGCLFVPMMSLLPTYFNTRLGLAIGIASSGSSLGGVIYPIVLRSLVYEIGFPWAVRVIGFMALATLITPCVVMKERIKPGLRKSRPMIDCSAFTDVPYMTFVAATMIGFVALTVPLFYISYFALEQQITDENLAFYIVPIYNAASIFGRILPNFLSDKIGPINVITPCALITGILLFVLISLDARQVGAFVVLSVLLGFFSGVFVAIPGTCFPRLIKDKSMLGTRVGMCFFMCAFALLLGGPAAGAILDPHPNSGGALNFKGLWCYGGAAAIISGFLYIVVRYMLTGPALKAKA